MKTLNDLLYRHNECCIKPVNNREYVRGMKYIYIFISRRNL